MPCAGEELDSNPGLLICSQVHYHRAPLLPVEPPLLIQDEFKGIILRNKICLILVSIEELAEGIQHWTLKGFFKSFLNFSLAFEFVKQPILNTSKF